VMGSHGIFHATVWILSVWHSHISISISHLRRRCRRSCNGLRMRTHSTLILLVCKSSRWLGLCGSVVISRHCRLILGITVVSSRRSSGIRVCSPLIHGESVGMEVSCRGRFRRMLQNDRAGVDCFLKLFGGAQKVSHRSGDRLATSDSRTRRRRRKNLLEEAVGAR
jgi:hypothetical protein